MSYDPDTRAALRQAYLGPSALRHDPSESIREAQDRVQHHHDQIPTNVSWEIWPVSPDILGLRYADSARGYSVAVQIPVAAWRCMVSRVDGLYPEEKP